MILGEALLAAMREAVREEIQAIIGKPVSLRGPSPAAPQSQSGPISPLKKPPSSPGWPPPRNLML